LRRVAVESRQPAGVAVRAGEVVGGRAARSRGDA